MKLLLQAVDADQVGTVNSEVSYQITKATPGLQHNFSINSSTGEITLTNPLDYELLDSTLEGKITLIVTAFDAGEPKRSSQVYVNITVEV